MNKREKKKLKEELYFLIDVYCNDCKYDVDRNKKEVRKEIKDFGDPCESCHRKNIYWKPSDSLLESIIEKVKNYLEK